MKHQREFILLGDMEIPVILNDAIPEGGVVLMNHDQVSVRYGGYQRTVRITGIRTTVDGLTIRTLVQFKEVEE